MDDRTTWVTIFIAVFLLSNSPGLIWIIRHWRNREFSNQREAGLAGSKEKPLQLMRKLGGSLNDLPMFLFLIVLFALCTALILVLLATGIYLLVQCGVWEFLWFVGVILFCAGLVLIIIFAVYSINILKNFPFV